MCFRRLVNPQLAGWRVMNKFAFEVMKRKEKLSGDAAPR